MSESGRELSLCRFCRPKRTIFWNEVVGKWVHVDTGLAVCETRAESERTSWVVAIDRPYYSSVEKFSDESEAVAAYEKLLAEHASDNPFEATVYVAEVVCEAPIRTVR